MAPDPARPRPLRYVRPAPGCEIAPEHAARVTVLAPLKGARATRVRRRRTTPEGWVPVYIGITARTHTDGRTKWLEAEHAAHWAWPAYSAALEHMRAIKQQGSTTLILVVWSPVWVDPLTRLVEIGGPAHHEKYVRSLCWTLSAEDVPESWAHQRTVGGAQLIEWRHSLPGDEERLQVPAPAKKRILQGPWSYAYGMERARSPLPHAKEVLAAYYAEHGVMPSIQLLAELLGVASTSSAHYVATRLRSEGFLAATEHGKLSPGPSFTRASALPELPTALVDVLPAGPNLWVVRVDETWTLDNSVWLGDMLILAPVDQVAEPSPLLVLRRGSAAMLALEPRKGWRVEGAVVGQYRQHGQLLPGPVG